MTSSTVMAALVAAIHDHPRQTVRMDGRDKPGHDAFEIFEIRC